MRDAPARAGHPVVFSLYEWGTSKPCLWARSVGHLWRSAGDIYNCWDCVKANGGGSKSFGVLRIIDVQDGLRQYAGSGTWNDPDMIEVGNGALTPSEDRAHSPCGACWPPRSSPATTCAASIPKPWPCSPTRT